MLTAEQFRALTPAKRAAFSKTIAKLRAKGTPWAKIRAEHGSWISDPVGRKLMRAVGSGNLVGRSYDEYRDGEARVGTAHAKFHGASANPKPKAKQTRKAPAKTAKK